MTLISVTQLTVSITTVTVTS